MPYVLAYDIANVFTVARLWTSRCGNGGKVHVQGSPDGSRVPFCPGDCSRGGGGYLGSRAGIYFGMGGRTRVRQGSGVCGIDDKIVQATLIGEFFQGKVAEGTTTGPVLLLCYVAGSS
jgi:hypothetical protein